MVVIALWPDGDWSDITYEDPPLWKSDDYITVTKDTPIDNVVSQIGVEKTKVFIEETEDLLD